ncbi:hypothetical protein EGW08_014218, partial [Elysia chlorotica]
MEVQTADEPPICLAAVVKHIPVELASRVVKSVVTDPTISEQTIECAVGQIVEWLKWPSAGNVDLWILCFLTELAADRKFSLLVRITELNTEQIAENLTYPQLRLASFKVLSQMLLSFQHSPVPFHKKLLPVLAELQRQSAGSSDARSWLVSLAGLLQCLMYQHSGFPELYDPVLDLIKDCPTLSQDEMKAKLRQSSWLSQVSGSVAMEMGSPAAPSVFVAAQKKLEDGKAGLDNLVNTCYMNSVLQALYMCDQFRRGILSKVPGSQESVLDKLQQVFALLCQSNRASISPSRLLQVSRPPWFLPGQQQDCSEFLKYLLDRLHEDEKGLAGGAGGPGGGFMRSLSTSSSGSVSPGGTLKKSDRKGAVTLTSIKKKNDDEMMSDYAPASLVESTFRGKVKTTLRCLACKAESTRSESFSDIPLAFPNCSRSQIPDSSNNPGVDDGEDGCHDTFSLDELIAFYLKTEHLTGDNKYHCDKCGKLQDGERSIAISQAPNYLILTLLRFSYNTKLQSRTKIFQDVRYPRTLALPVDKSAQSTLQLAERLSPRSAETGSPLSGPKPEQQCELYGLSALVVHSGTSSECGHYYCYARHSRGGQVDPALLDKTSEDLDSVDLLPDMWYNFNDSRVSHAKFETF